ncbi:MAG: hypothetical protein WCA49_10310 [Candidatus Sulfotelmatobacter sp.]
MNLLLRYIPLGLLALLLFLLVRRRAYKVCPWFFAYVAFAVAADMARFATHNHAHSLFATYWITEAGYDVLGILVMYELIRTVLRNLARTRWARLIFPTALILGIGLSLARAHASPPQFSGLYYYIVVGEIAVRCVQVLIFVATVVIVLVLGLRWRQYPFGIATGFGLYSVVALLMTTKFSDFGTRFRFLWGWSLLVAYSLAVMIWIWFFSAPQKPETPNPNLPTPSPEAFKEYQAMLERYLNSIRRIR